MPVYSEGDQREREWLKLWRLAREYYEEHGDLLIPGSYVSQGERLGAWIGTQRWEYKRRMNPRLTRERIDRLEAIGMVWDVKEFRWQSMYSQLEKYLSLHGNIRVPQSYVTPEGIRLGTWLNKVRTAFKRGKLSKDRQKQLEALGIDWSPELLRRGSWEHYFQLLRDHVDCNGSFPSSGYVTEKGDKLGIWLSNQRRKEKLGALSWDRRQRLEELGMVWDVPEQMWEERYNQAQAYYLECGHLGQGQRGGLSMSASLSQWLTAQRKAWRAGTLSEEKIKSLEAIGMRWELREELWEISYGEAKAYFREHGHLRVPREREPYASLGRWISTQRKSRKAHRLSRERIRKLEEIGMVWDAGTEPETLWENWFARAEAYSKRYGHLSPAKGKLRTWILAQRAAKKGKRGQLTEEQIRRLEEIGMIWDAPAEQWQRMYQLAREYYQIHQMLNIPCNYVTETGERLGSWIVRQRRCYKNYLAGRSGGGIGAITPERIALLNEIGMIWDGTQLTARTSFPEKALLFYLRKHFPDAVKHSRWQQPEFELDLYIPSRRTAVEYDGNPWHRDKKEQDERKGKLCREHGISLIRIREKGLPQVAHCQQVIELTDFREEALEAAISSLFGYPGVPCPSLDIKGDRKAILETYRNYTARAWDRVYEEILRYYREKGSLKIPENFVSDSGISLAGWLNCQRDAYRNNELTDLQIRKLEQLGIRWAPHQERWENMYQLAAAYAKEQGELSIPHDYVTGEGVRLGAWLASQRELYRKHKLEPRRIYLLEQLGIHWEPLKERQKNYLAAARDYHEKTGGLDIPAAYITGEGLRLGEWLVKQRSDRRAGVLDPERIRQLEEMGIRWEPFDSRWEEMYALAREYYQAHGELRIPYSYKAGQGQPLGRWLSQQRRKLSGTGGHRRLTEEQKRRLDEIGMVWEPCEDEWMKKYRRAREFYQAHGHLQIPVDYVTEDGIKLGMWLACQRKAMRGNPNYRMSGKRQRMLEEIGIEWTTPGIISAAGAPGPILPDSARGPLRSTQRSH